MRLRVGLLGVVMAIAATAMMSVPAYARDFGIVGPYASMSAVPSEYKYQGSLLTYQNCTNNGFDNDELFAWVYSNIGTKAAEPIKVDITHNSALNWKAGMTGSCEKIVMYGEKSNTMVYPLLDGSGNPTGYGFKHDCGNLVKYDVPQEGWKSNGETEIFSQTSGWTKAHPRGSEMQVAIGDTVRWHHRVNITDSTGGPTIKIKATTISKKGTSVVTLDGGSANYTSQEFTIPNGQTSTGWQERSWKVPTTAAPGDIYCQYWEWTPSESGNDSSKANSENNKEQCVKVEATDWSLSGTTKLNGGTTDIQVEPDTCVTWTHTLTKIGTVAVNSAVNFQQKRTEGDSYGNADCGGQSGGLKTGSVASLPATNPYNIPLGQVSTFSIKVPEGKTYCQNLGWTVAGDASKNGQTARLCASTLATGSDTEYVSRLRACAVKVRSIAGNTVENCTPWVTPNNSPQAAATNFAKTQDNIKFRYQVEKIAQYQSRQSANYRPLAAFDQSKTICSTNSTEAKDCVAKTPTAYNPPTTPGGTGTLNPGYLSPAMEPWYRAADNCTLAGPSRSLAGLAPTSCTSSESQLASGYSYTYEGSGHDVKNADLGLTKSDLTQKISLSDVKIVVHKNNDTHTYTYDYAKKHTGSCSSNSGGSAGCSSCTPPTSDTRWSCPGVSYTWYGQTSITVRSQCTRTQSCTGPTQNGVYTRDAVGTYDNNEHTWIEVMPDGPISAEVSFAIPYNYDVMPQLNFLPDNAQRIQIGGTELAYSASFAVQPRMNGEVGETYATATRPGTKWQVVEFYLPPSTSNPGWGGTMTHNGSALTCSAYSGSAYDCNYTTGTGSLNTQSETNTFNLQNGSTFNMGLTQRRIQDAPIGTKYCVSAAVMDYSSHNGGSGFTAGNGYTDSMLNIWKMTKPECVSIGKMPMTNVVADGLYSDGKIEGATFKKLPSGQSTPGAFGSWGEYEIVSNSSVKNIASGAALGVGAGGVPLGGSTAYTMLSENINNGSCQIAPLTFANVNCSTTSTMSELGRMGGASTSNGLARNIRHRYTGRSDATNVGGSISPNSYNTCSNAQVTSTNSAGTSCVHYVKANGNLTINAGSLNSGRSLIVEATGTVTISGSITISNGSYTDISQIPQIMIFANAINIDNAATQVDAWLLAGLNSGSGTINTCTGIASAAALDGNTCSNRLKISGPVIANKVLLHRTNGAGVSMPASAQAAEIFYLSPATYLWAYNQSANLSQAYLTYAREVAPRF